MIEEVSSARRKQEKNAVYKADQIYGSQKENELLPIINNFFKGLYPESESFDLKPTKNYFVFDYETPNVYIELKSRRNRKEQYPTTIVGKNKLDYAETCGKDVFFVFNFSDGIFYWKYDKSVIGDKITFDRGGRFDRGRVEVKTYAYISVDILLPIAEN